MSRSSVAKTGCRAFDLRGEFSEISRVFSYVPTGSTVQSNGLTRYEVSTTRASKTEDQAGLQDKSEATMPMFSHVKHTWVFSRLVSNLLEKSG
jgi:hypothetical protein